jgi:hypothetical protein
MKHKFFIIFGIIALLVVLAVILTLPDDSPTKDRQIVIELQSEVLPFVLEKNITLFFNQDWCRALKYGETSVVEVLNSTGGSTCLSEGKPFSDDDQLIFEETKAKLDSIAAEELSGIQLEYPLIYEPEHANLPRESIGLGFLKKCSFCRIRYVYSPNYEELPSNVESEITYTPINQNWYRVDQDWN